LQRSLVHLGFGLAEVVWVKAVIRLSAEHAADARELAASFGGGPVPAVVVME
jgi:hypothetical protein